MSDAAVPLRYEPRTLRYEAIRARGEMSARLTGARTLLGSAVAEPLREAFERYDEALDRLLDSRAQEIDILAGERTQLDERLADARRDVDHWRNLYVDTSGQLDELVDVLRAALAIVPAPGRRPAWRREAEALLARHDNRPPF
jgi:hypothetical protein